MRSAKALSTPSVIIVIDIRQAFPPLAAFQLCRAGCMFSALAAIGKRLGCRADSYQQHRPRPKRTGLLAIQETFVSKGLLRC
jgi:hypothetical protein